MTFPFAKAALILATASLVSACGSKASESEGAKPDYTTCPANALTPKRLGSFGRSQRNLVTNGSAVFFTTELTNPPDGMYDVIASVPVGGGRSDFLYRSADVTLDTEPLVLDGDTLYFATASVGLASLPTAGGAPTALLKGRFYGSYDVDADSIYTSSQVENKVERTLKSGGPTTTLWTASVGALIEDVRVDGDNLYVEVSESHPSLYRLPKTGGTATLISTLPSGLFESPTAREHELWVGSKVAPEGPMVCPDGGGSDGGVDGGGGTLVGGTCASGSSPAQNWYLTVYAGTLDGAPRVIVKELFPSYFSLSNRTALAIRDGVVYYGTSSGLKKVPYAGGTPETVISTDDGVEAVTFADAKAYMLSGGCLYAAAK